MNTWPSTRLGDHLRVKHGFAFQGEYFSDSGEYVVLTPGNFIEAGGFKPKSGAEKYFTADPPPDYVLRRGDLVIAMTEQAQGLLGSSALIPADGVYLHNQRIGLIQPTSGQAHLRFLYYLFNTPGVREQIQATATGSKVRHTAPSRVENVRILLPPIATQRNIAAILSAYDDLIQNNNRRIKLLEAMAQRIYREWFVDFRYPGHETVPLTGSELGPAPSDWSLRPLGEVVAQSRASVNPSRFPGETFEHYSIPSFDEGRRPRLEAGDEIKSSKFLVNGPCVLYSKLNPRIPRVWMAAPRASGRAVASTELLVLSDRGGWNLPLIYCLLRSEQFGDRVAGMAGGTSTSHQRVRPGELLALRVLDAGNDLARLFERRVGAILTLAQRSFSARLVICFSPALCPARST